MDRSFLFQPQVDAASRNFVCVRLATYEDETEAAFLKAFTSTKSGQLENSVFGILAPDGQQKLIRSGRGPKHAFAGPAEMADTARRREWRRIVLKKRSGGPAVGKPSERSMELFFLASYNLDGFRDFISTPGCAFQAYCLIFSIEKVTCIVPQSTYKIKAHNCL
jgi:hypothetical protein